MEKNVSNKKQLQIRSGRLLLSKTKITMYQFNKFKNFENLILGISTKSDGNMSFSWGKKEEVIKNRKKFLKKLGVSQGNCVISNLEHDTQIKEVNSSHKGQVLNDGKIVADAIVTTEKSLFLVMFFGDCLPMIFYDSKKEILALAHISIANTGKKFAEKIIITLGKKYSCSPANLIVGFGPAIHKDSYRKENLKQIKVKDWEGFLKRTGGKITIDIIGYNKKQLINARVKEKNIEISDIDTVQSPEFFSHYRSKRTGEEEGRFAMVVGMV